LHSQLLKSRSIASTTIWAKNRSEPDGDAVCQLDLRADLNYKYIDHIQITVAETVNVDDRAGYYETSGAMRDMNPEPHFPDHGAGRDGAAIRLGCNERSRMRSKVYRSVRPIRPGQFDEIGIRGQYSAGVANGKETQGYLKPRAWQPARKSRRLPRSSCHRQLALERHAVLYSHG